MHALVPLPDLFAFTCLVLFSNSTTIVLIDAAEVVLSNVPNHFHGDDADTNLRNVVASSDVRTDLTAMMWVLSRSC